MLCALGSHRNLVDPQYIIHEELKVTQDAEVNSWRDQSDLLRSQISSQSLISVAFRNIVREALVFDVTVIEHLSHQAQDFHKAGGCQLQEHRVRGILILLGKNLAPF